MGNQNTMPELELPPEVRDFCRRLRQNDPTLKGDELWGKGVDDNGAKAIAKALMINKNLTYLNLGGNQIGDEGARAIAEAWKIHLQQSRKQLEDPFKWINDSFGNWETRQRMQSVLDEQEINEAIANAVKIGLRNKMTASIRNYDFHTFYPAVIISYSTGNRNGIDAESAGPGLLVVTSVINHLLNEGYHCYSDIFTPGGEDWNEYMKRVKKAKVMIVLMTRTFFRSVHCLREVSAASRAGVALIPVRCEESSNNGKDVSRDRDEMWPLDELAKYSKHQQNEMFVLGDLNVQREEAVKILSEVSSIPAHGTLLSAETAVDELVGRVGVLVNPTRPRNQDNMGVVDQEEKAEMEEIGIVGIHFTTTDLERWQDFFAENESTLLTRLETLASYGELREGELQITLQNLLSFDGRERAVLQLHCGIEIREDLKVSEYHRVREICHQTAMVLKDVGDVSDDELRSYMIGTAYLGSIVLLIEATSSVFEKLFSTMKKQTQIPLGIHGASIVGLAPALLVKGPFVARLHEAVQRHCKDEGPDAFKWQDEELTLLIPTSTKALGKIRSGGVKLLSKKDEDWKGLALVNDAPYQVYETIKALTSSSRAFSEREAVDKRSSDSSVGLVDDNGAKAITKAFMINTNLTYLNLGGNQIGDEGAKAIAEAWKIHPKLERLDLAGNRIGDEGARAIAEAWKINNNLKTLYLGGNRFGVEGANAIAVALAAKKRPDLEWISIGADCDDSTAKVFVRAIKEQKFPSLEHLYGLVELKEHLSELQVPQEFAFKDNDEILRFLHERWESGEERLSVVKVVVTGPGSVGKTCLVTRLVQNKFPENTQMTNGVDVVRTVDNNGIEYVYYDFGGQPVYATTHQLFLRTRAVFVVVWDARSETADFEHQAFHQYARDILDASPEAQMIFVSTKSDQGYRPLSKNELQELEMMYKGHFLGYHHISAQRNTGIEDLTQEITQAATLVLQDLGGEHGLEGMVVPKTWVELKQKIASLRDSQEKFFFLSPDEWDSLVKSVNIVEEERAERVLRLFHQMGEVHCLPTGQIVIDPPRLTEVLSRVVTDDQQYVKNARGGYLRHRELGQVWGDWDKQLHNGFLELLHECEIGYQIRDDDGTNYDATLIPAMLYRNDETLKEYVTSLAEENIQLEKGLTLTLEISTGSSRLGPKLVSKLRGVTIIGGWGRNGCIVVDTGGTKTMKAFGRVSWIVEAGVMLISIMTFGAYRLLNFRALNALGACLEEFPGVHLVSAYMHCGGSGCSGGWSKKKILSCKTRSIECSICGRRPEVIDVREWIVRTFEGRPRPDRASFVEESEVQDRVEEEARAQDSFSHLRLMLQDDSGASAEMLCYLLLTHQKDLLTHGCGHGAHGRLKLNALWLVYKLKDGSLVAYPLCPHAEPNNVLFRKDLGQAGVVEADFQVTNPDQGAFKNLLDLILKDERLGIGPPAFKACFSGTIWHYDPDSELMYNIQESSKTHFKKVNIPEIGQVWVHESDEGYFQDKLQVNLINKLKEEVEASVKASVNSGKEEIIHAVEGSEQKLQASVNHGFAHLSTSLSKIKQDLDNLPQLLVQLENVKCPYLFNFMEETEFKTWKKELAEKEEGPLNNAVAQELEAFLVRARSLFDSSKDFTEENQTDASAAVKRRWNYFIRKQQKVVYLQLLCGWTLKPVVSYKVTESTFPKWFERFASLGGKGCAGLVKVAILWNTGARIAGMFGYPAPRLPKDEIRKAKKFFDEVNQSSPVDDLKKLQADGGFTVEDLWGFDVFLDELEKGNRMRQCFDEFDKKELEGKKWTAVLCHQTMELGGGKKQITFVSTKEGERFGSKR